MNGIDNLRKYLADAAVRAKSAAMNLEAWRTELQEAQTRVAEAERARDIASAQLEAIERALAIVTEQEPLSPESQPSQPAPKRRRILAQVRETLERDPTVHITEEYLIEHFQIPRGHAKQIVERVSRQTTSDLQDKE